MNLWMSSCNNSVMKWKSESLGVQELNDLEIAQRNVSMTWKISGDKPPMIVKALMKGNSITWNNSWKVPITLREPPERYPVLG